MAKTQKPAADLEKALSELEKLVDELESGDLPLEQAMKKFERGVKLTRDCQSALADAEQRVDILLADSEVDSGAEPFEAPPD